MGEAEDKTGDAGMFAIFIFSVVALGVIPMTIWRVSTGGGAKVQVVQPWRKKDGKARSLGSRVGDYVNNLNIALLVGWLLMIALALYISTCTLAQAEYFDPFAILGIDTTADKKAIKRAYRNLAKTMHPDKNPDPAAGKFFAEKVVKAYQALTDEAARENWIKHGHPDGEQAMKIGVALPDWIFTSNKRTAPLVLLALSFLGLAVPILAAAAYLWRSEGYVGANKVSERTITYYHRYGIKEMMRVAKVPEALVPSTEFVNIRLKKEQEGAMAEFVAAMKRTFDGATSVPKWWTQSAELMRTHLFLLAHFERRPDLVPAALRRDFHETLRLLPIMAAEFAKAAVVPRNRMMRGWFLPSEAAVQFMQCTAQAVRPEVRSPSAEEKKKKKFTVGDAAAAMLQLPGVDEDVLRALEKGHKIKTAEDLAKLPEAERRSALAQCGVADDAAGNVEKMLLSLPHVHVTAVKVFVDGEDDIKEGDMVTIQVFVALTRASHADGGGAAPLGRASVQAFTPRYPHPLQEKWHAYLSNQKVSSPSSWGYKDVELLEAEVAGADNYETLSCRWAPKAGPTTVSAAGSAASSQTAAGQEDAIVSTSTSKSNGAKGDAAAGGEAGSGDEVGQKIEFKFMLHEPGRFVLTFVLMPSCWLGCDVSVPVTLNVLRQTAAEREGKVTRRGGHGKATAVDPDDVDDDSDEEDGSDSDSDDNSEGWDTDETGTDVSHESDDEGDVVAGKGDAAQGAKKSREPKKLK